MEEWRDIPGWEGIYQVSSLGRVRSLDRSYLSRRPSGNVLTCRIKGRVLKPTQHEFGYLRVTLCRGAEVRMLASIHQLVAAAFIGPCQDGMLVCHNDGNPSRNVPDNLRYDTPAGNSGDMKRHGTLAFGENCSTHKLTDADVAWIRANLPGPSVRSVAKKFGVARSTIRAALGGETWKHLQQENLNAVR